MLYVSPPAKGSYVHRVHVYAFQCPSLSQEYKQKKPLQNASQPPSRFPHSAANDARPGVVVLLPPIIRHTSLPIDIRQNRGIILRVHTRNLHCLARREASSARDLNLRAALVELCPHALVRRVQRQDLYAKKVLPVRHAAWQREVPPPVIRNHRVHPPHTARRVECLLGHLEPLETGVVRRRGVVDGREPGGYGTLVGGGDGVVGVALALGPADDVLVPRAELGAGGDWDDVRGGEGYLPAGEVWRGDVLDGVVLVGCADADQGALVLAVDAEVLGVLVAEVDKRGLREGERERGGYLEDAVSGGKGRVGQGVGDGELHGDGFRHTED